MSRPKARAVLVLSHLYPRTHSPSSGIFVHEQVKALRAKGLDVRVLSGEPYWINNRNPLGALRAFRHWWRLGHYHWDHDEGVPVIRFPYIVSGKLPFGTHAFFYRIAARRCLNRLAEAWSFDLVHAHTAYTDGSAGTVIARRLGVPLVITEHTGPFSMLTRTPYLRRRTQKSLNAASWIIAVSRSLLRDISREVTLSEPNNVSIVANLVDTTSFEVRDRVPDGRIRALWVGHFVAVKRLDRLLRAFAQVAATNPNMVLRLVGDGELKAEIYKLVDELQLSDKIEFAGFACREQLSEHYRASDFLVISSDTETFGVVAIEAMSCGRPVLSTECGGPSEVITEPELGMIVRTSEEGLVNGLVTMQARAGTFDAKSIREAAIKRFSAPVIAERVCDVYSRVLERTIKHS